MKAGKQPNCAICGAPVDAWPGGGGWGHNPAPVLVSGKACDWCNENVVIPLRLRHIQRRSHE